MIVMHTIKAFLEFLSGKEFAIPLSEVALLVMINSICLLLGKHRMGLMVTYFFVFYWGFVFNKPYFVDLLGQMTWGLVAYAVLGILMAVVVIAAFFIRSKE